MAKTVIALYDDLRDAHAAMEDLRASSTFTSRDITLMAHDADNRYSRYLEDNEVEVEETGTEADTGAAAGAGIGAVVGGIGGFLLGAGVIFIPGLGPVLAAGPVAAALIGAVGGAAAGGIVGGLIGLGIPEEEAHVYAEGLKRGGTLVVVRAPEDSVEEAADVLSAHSPVDIQRRAGVWRDQGWEGEFAPTDDIYTTDRIEREYASYPEMAGQSATPRAYEQEMDVVGQHYNRLEPNYREHFDANYADGDDFDSAKFGYRFGTMLGTDRRYAREDWNAVRAAAHKQWAQHTDKSWEKFKNYVKYGWYKTKEELWDATTAGDGERRSQPTGRGSRR